MRIPTRQYTQRTRAEAAEATGRRIVEAFLARLMAQWFDEITLDQVAADAGVTVQTVVRRFGGKEGLLSDAVKTLAPQIKARRAAPSGDVDRLVENLLGDYEKTGDAVVRLLALEPRHPALKTVLDFGRRSHREWTRSAFAGALEPLEAPARERSLDALVTVTDVYTWKLLRRDMGRSVHATAIVMKNLIRATITEIETNNEIATN
jgi:AcrR family transcriptional regulator